jgi:hypothetical protein
MKRMSRLLWKSLLAAAVLFLAVFSTQVSAFPCGLYPPINYTQKQGEWYDFWGFNRNYYNDANGYMPNIAYETLGANKELAYSIGVQFKNSYSSKIQRAEAILDYVQRWTEYGYDEDNVFINGEPQPEWAWNADEMAHKFNVTTNIVAVGDCEDMGFLCGTLYLAAGFDVSLVLAPSHVALLIWLPEYDNANYYWDINDGRGNGWIWVEATGENNPLGWTPPDFTDGNWETYTLNSVISNIKYDPQNPEEGDDVIVTASIMPESGQVSQVTLRYSIDGGTYNTLPMTLQGSYYGATIPAQPTGTEVKFFISVTDTDNNYSESGIITYTVGGQNVQQIPGFPFESIIMGLIIGLAAVYLLVRKRVTLP